MECPYMIALPARLNDLSEAEFADLYDADGEGGHVLKAVAVEAINEANADLQRRWDDFEVGLTERDVKLVKRDAKLKELAASSAIRDALILHGVNPKMVDMATAYLVKKLELEVFENDDGEPSVMALSVSCGQSVEAAVACWLAGPQGALFAPRSSPHGGPLTEAVRRLRGKH